jgi:ketosteroid isomerase-like protein
MISNDFDPAAAANRFLDLLEAGDRSGVEGMLSADVTWTTPMTATGNVDDGERVEGREAFQARASAIGAMMRSTRFVDRRVTTSADGATTFVQTRGDFRSADGRPYRNVYVFRFDWQDGRLAAWEEYANPITILRTFPDVFGDALRQLAAGS